MSIHTKTNKLTEADRYRSLMKGLDSDLANVTTFEIDGRTFTKVALVALFQGHLDAIGATAATKATWKQAVVKEREAAVVAKKGYAAVVRYLRSRFGPTAEQLADFGVAPAKPHRSTAATKAEGAVKGLATRRANHPPRKRKGSQAAAGAPGNGQPVKA